MERMRSVLVLSVFIAFSSIDGQSSTTFLEDIDSRLPELRLDVLCSLGEEQCNGDCYNPTKQQCLVDAYGTKRVCNSNEILCGWQCLPTDDASLTCVNNEICLTGQQACSAECYSPDTHHCLNNAHLCPINETDCGYVCYDPTDKEQKCVEAEYTSYVCKSNEEVCLSWGCYDPLRYKCFVEQDRICGIEETLCGYNECLNSTNGEICVDNKRVCKLGEALCGIRCYNPSNSDKVCHNDRLLCKPEETACGDDRCYDPASGSTCHEAAPDYHIVCEDGLDYCDHNCYDKETDECIFQSADSNGVVCPKGYEICRGDSSSYVSVYSCYDPSTQVCIKNEWGTALCEKDQEICGTNCYEPEEIVGKRCFEQSGIFCKQDEDICGSVCYSKSTSTCFENVSVGNLFIKQ